MKSFLQIPFPYLDRFRHRMLHVLIILVFSILFLIIFEPFRINDWIRYPEWLEIFGLVSVGVCIGVTIACSQLLVRSFVPVKVFTYGHFLLWTLSEVLLVSLIATAIYADYSSTFFQELLISLRFIPTGLVLPYAFSMLVLMLLRQKSKGSGSGPVSPPENPDLIHIRDEREQVKFSVRRENILYLESSDNYVCIFYLTETGIKKEMIRSSMKKMEPLLSPAGLLRCHRSFMVNMENVQWMKKKGRSYQIKMKTCETIIPVSRSYHPVVKTLIQE